MKSYNIIDEFKSSIQQTVFNANEYIFVFPGNPTDFKNYKHYLQAKANNFSSPKEFSWSMWSPSNFSFVSKNYVQFLIDNFTILQEKEQEINNLKININTNSQRQNLQKKYKKLEKKFLEQVKKINQQANIIKTQSEEILSQELQIKQQQENIKTQTQEIKKQMDNIFALQQEIEDKKQELTNNQKLTEQQKQVLDAQIVDLTTKINNHQTKNNFLESQIIDFSDNLSQKEVEIKRLTNISQAEKNKLQEKIDIQKLFIKDNTNQFNDLKIQYQNLQQEHQKIQQKIQEQTETLKEQANIIKTQSEEIKTQSDAIINFKDDLLSTIEGISEKTFDALQEANKKINNLTEQTKQEQENKILNSITNVQQFKVNSSKMPEFKDLIGMKEEVEQLQEFLHYLKNTDQYKDIGVQKPPKGVLLYGPPGTGKTFLAKIIAGESKLPFFTLNSSHFSKQYVGEGPTLINEIFKQARQEAPSIIFIDECESVFRSRISNKATNSDHDNIISAFLSQTEGFEVDSKHPVFLIGATNYKDEIDAAILSRFNRQIKINLLNAKDRKVFTKKLAKKYRIDIRGYQYLDKMNDIIENQFDMTLKSQRKLTDILDQAAIKAVNTHNHLSILPVDLQLTLNRQMNIDFNWEEHAHNPYSLSDLENLKEYKGVKIKHLYKDHNNFHTRQEAQYFNVIFNYPKERNQKVFNINDHEIKKITFSKELNKIQNFYGTLDFLPQELIGFYFQDMPNNDHINIPNVNTLEEFLDIRGKKSQNIYFIWNINKIQRNIDFLHDFMNTYNVEYPFLIFQNIWKKLNILIYQKDTNQEIMQHEIIKYIDDIKKQFTEEILKENVIQNNWFSEQEIMKHILSTVEKEFQPKKTYSSLLEMKNFILQEIKNQIYNDKKLYINNYIQTQITNFQIKHPIFNSNDITNTKRKIKNKINNLCSSADQIEKITKEEFENSIIKIKNQQITEMIQNQLNNIIDNFHFNYSVITKNKIKNMIASQIKDDLFQPNLSFEKFNQKATNMISGQEGKLLNNLTEEIIENIINKEISKNNLIEPINAQEIESMKTKIMFFLKQEAKKPDISQEKIQKSIENFINNYEFIKSNDAFSYFKKHITTILSFTIPILFFTILLSNTKNKNIRK
ncbi:AAA family ATPase ['Fragaria x ananassa' phyllody phytoplasma]|uniref:AAA family ATPase n=2 Tax='Fragaria x ananassa' phyllody phytoplasma TaxID=2358428 RepID=A0ABS5K411_9MOLU|nr:AAA family ATPase ['Fragaria x ananassa' phyllody phytoplasma]